MYDNKRNNIIKSRTKIYRFF